MQEPRPRDIVSPIHHHQYEQQQPAGEKEPSEPSPSHPDAVEGASMGSRAASQRQRRLVISKDSIRLADDVPGGVVPPPAVSRSNSQAAIMHGQGKRTSKSSSIAELDMPLPPLSSSKATTTTAVVSGAVKGGRIRGSATTGSIASDFDDGLIQQQGHQQKQPRVYIPTRSSDSPFGGGNDDDDVLSANQKGKSKATGVFVRMPTEVGTPRRSLKRLSLSHSSSASASIRGVESKTLSDDIPQEVRSTTANDEGSPKKSSRLPTWKTKSSRRSVVDKSSMDVGTILEVGSGGGTPPPPPPTSPLEKRPHRSARKSLMRLSFHLSKSESDMPPTGGGGIGGESNNNQQQTSKMTFRYIPNRGSRGGTSSGVKTTERSAESGDTSSAEQEGQARPSGVLDIGTNVRKAIRAARLRRSQERSSNMSATTDYEIPNGSGTSKLPMLQRRPDRNTKTADDNAVSQHMLPPPKTPIKKSTAILSNTSPRKKSSRAQSGDPPETPARQTRSATKLTGSAVRAMAALFENASTKENFVPTPMQKVSSWDPKPSGVLSQYTVNPSSSGANSPCKSPTKSGRAKTTGKTRSYSNQSVGQLSWVASTPPVTRKQDSVEELGEIEREGGVVVSAIQGEENNDPNKEETNTTGPADTAALINRRQISLTSGSEAGTEGSMFSMPRPKAREQRDGTPTQSEKYAGPISLKSAMKSPASTSSLRRNENEKTPNKGKSNMHETTVPRQPVRVKSDNSINKVVVIRSPSPPEKEDKTAQKKEKQQKPQPQTPKRKISFSLRQLEPEAESAQEPSLLLPAPPPPSPMTVSVPTTPPSNIKKSQHKTAKPTTAAGAMAAAVTAIAAVTPRLSPSPSPSPAPSPAPVVTESSNKKTEELHAQIRTLQQQLADKTDEVTQLRAALLEMQKQLQQQSISQDTATTTIGIGGDSDNVIARTAALRKLLRETENECRRWRERAEAAEKRVALFVRFGERLKKLREEGKLATTASAAAAADGEDGVITIIKPAGKGDVREVVKRKKEMGSGAVDDEESQGMGGDGQQDYYSPPGKGKEVAGVDGQCHSQQQDERGGRRWSAAGEEHTEDEETVAGRIRMVLHGHRGGSRGTSGINSDSGGDGSGGDDIDDMEDEEQQEYYEVEGEEEDSNEEGEEDQEEEDWLLEEETGPEGEEETTMLHHHEKRQRPHYYHGSRSSNNSTGADQLSDAAAGMWMAAEQDGSRYSHGSC
ncbi:hypothetical protein B0T17DRAFT_516221 [Bombardia bombarda]|uniref:Uncharacterized protein n=1 Tax=Bombardia bombarda TaxID=252184 RepID=A0AA39XLV8_9PEZI|nr:hypothetical protein B0T17DRAFT_516221 [Bombardia bombarda]